MERLIQSKDHYQYALENLKEDPDWGFLYSYSIESLSGEEHEASRSFPKMSALRTEMLSKLAESKLDPIDRFQEYSSIYHPLTSVIDLKKESFRKAKNSSYENWEKKIAQFCISMHQSVQRYYYRKALTFREILQSASLDRDPMLLLGGNKSSDPSMEAIALGSWVFTTMPGNVPTTGWPFDLPLFYERMIGLKPLTLWAEPFDESFAFQEAAYQFIGKQLDILATECPPDKLPELKESLRLALMSTLHASLNSGSYDRLLSFMNFLLDHPAKALDQTVSDCAEEISKAVRSCEKYCESFPFLHYIRPDSLQGSFKIAKTVNFNGQKGSNCSIATDGTYLYIFMTQGSKGYMYKIGTGEYGTVAGKVYLYTSTDKETDGCWVFCKGKLYLRRASEEIGLVSIICPDTFKKLGTLKLCCEDAFKEPATLKYNKTMPLLTDGDSLFIVTMQVKTVKRKLRPEKQEEYERLKKDEEEAKRKEADKGKAPAIKKAGPKDVKKEEKKQPQLSDTAKICEFNLVEFDVDAQKEETDRPLDPKNEALVDELYSSFSGYFSKQECGYALRINKNDIQNAAHWLVDEGENERGKVAVIAKSSVLLAQSVVRPGLEIDVYDDALLFPYNVTNGLWTMTKSQVTLHSSYPHAKIFSISPGAVKPLSQTRKPASAALIPQSHSPSEALEEDLRPALSRQIAQTGFFGGEDPSANESAQADAFFEEIELKGTYITSAQMEYLQYDHATLTYDHTAHKFYILFLSNSIIGTTLEYGDVTELNESTMTKGLGEALKAAKDRPKLAGAEDLVLKLLGFMKEAEGLKYSLPWKWDQWDTLYSKMSDRFCLSIPPQKSSDASWKKASERLQRLKTKSEKFREKQELIWAQQFDLKHLQLAHMPPKYTKSIPVSPTKDFAYSRPRGVRPLPPPELYSSSPRHPFHGHRPVGIGIKGAPVMGEEEPEFAPNESLPPIKYAKDQLLPPPHKIRGKAPIPLPRPASEIQGSLSDFAPSDDQDLSKNGSPAKKVQVVRENKKQRPFCSIGSASALKLLMAGIKKCGDEPSKKTMLLGLYDQLLGCVLQVGVLAPAPQMGYAEKLEELVEHLLGIIRDAKADPDVLNYAWRILMNGWPCLVRTTERQSLVFQEALKAEKYAKSTQSVAQGNWYYRTMLSPCSTPLQLFCMKHCQYQTSFYLDYPLRQSNVQVFDAYEAVQEFEGGKGRNKASRADARRLRFVEAPQGKSDNSIIEMCCGKEVWPKLSGLLLLSSEQIENDMIRDHGLTLDNVMAFYSGVKCPSDKSMPEEELQKHKRELVNKLREQHNERVNANWERISKELLQEVDSALVWKAFNKLIAFAAEEVAAKGPQMVELASRSCALLESLLARFKDFISKENENPRVMAWIDNFLDFTFWVSTMLHVGQGYVWETEYAASVMPRLMSLLAQLKEICVGTSDSVRTLVTSNSFSENVDHAYEKIFETPHPYGRGELTLKDYANFPCAIAISCEVDPHSQTENSNDYLHIFTSEVSQNIYPGIGTTLRLSGRSSKGQEKWILIGSKAMIEFRVTSQPRKKEDVACRWGYKVTLRPIYGEPLAALARKDGSEQKFKQLLKVNLPERQLLQLLTSTNNFVALASRLISSMMKGIDLVPEEAACRELFALPIMKEGLKRKPVSKPLFERKTDTNNKVDPTNQKPKEYKFKCEVVEPPILQAIDDVENASGWIIGLMGKMRQLVGLPNPYVIEQKRPSFEDRYRKKWALAERYTVLALIYHARCDIGKEGVQISESELQKIGQSTNNVIQWMLAQLMGEKDYFVLRTTVLEECNKYYAKFRAKKLEELKTGVEEVKSAPKPAKEEKAILPRRERVTVARSGPGSKKRVKFEKPPKPKEEEDAAKKAGTETKSTEEIKISGLSPGEKREFKQKLYQEIYDTFLQRYQGNFDLVKGLCGVLGIQYTANDPAEALKQIFKKLQEALKDIIDLSSPDSLPENVDPSQLQTKSPYEVVADHVIERAKFLLECKRLEKKPGGVPMIPLVSPPPQSQPQKGKDSHHLTVPLIPLELQRSSSLQPFLQDAKTPEEMQRAVDSYLKWKRAKIAMDEELMTSDSPHKGVVSIITSSTAPVTLKSIMKLQQRRGLLRALGLGYQYELMQQFNKTMFKRLIIGNATDSLLYGPFSFIEGSGSQITSPITSHSLKLCNAIVETLREDCGRFKEIKRAVKKMTKKNPDNKGMDENCICEHMKRLLLVFSDLTVLLQGMTNNNIIINLCTSSTTKSLSEFLSSIVDIILMSQSYSAELQSNPPVAKLNSLLIGSCQVILNRFLVSAQEISAPEAKSSIQQLLLQIFVDTLRRECGLAHPIKDAFLRFESPLHQLRFTQLLSFLYEILLIFEKITDIDPGLLQKCASLLCYLLHISAAPCIVRLASKCAQLLYKFIDVDSIPTAGVIPLPSITSECQIAMTAESPNNVVAHTLRRMGQFVMMRNCTPASGAASRSKMQDYYVVMNMNSNENDATFVLTALYHWETMHPFFTECYPQTLAAAVEGQKEQEFGGLLANSRLAQLSTIAKSAPRIYSAAMLQFEKLFDEIMKLTYEEAKSEDSEQEKLRKLMEKNYNRRVRQHIQDAKLLTAYLLTRSFVQFPVPLLYDRAMELCDLLDKAYNKQLAPIPINPHMKPDSKTKKTSTGTTVEASFPLTYRKQPKTGTQNPPQPPIIIAKSQLVLSLCEVNTFDKIEPYLDSLSSHSILSRHKAALEGAGMECLQTPIVVGASFSVTLQELIQLLRSMLVPNAAGSWHKYISTYLQKALELLSTKKWVELSEEDREIILGCLILVSGWSKCVRPGTLVEATVNNNKSICTVVSGGYGTGKHSVTVIVKGDDSFVTHKIPLSQVRPFEEYKWPESVALSDELLINAALNCHLQCGDASLTPFDSQTIRLLRVLILKMSAGRNWRRDGEFTASMNKFIDVLAELSRESSAEIIKANCEEKLIESWERLLENEDPSYKLFYVPKRHNVEVASKESINIGKKGESKSFLEYVQPMSSYLKSLPGRLSDAHASEEASLKLLNYWEKHLIPKIQDFVRSSYKPWENLYYFEQLRDRLRKGDINKAMEEALEMCDRRLPSGCVPPDENQDWSAFVTEECIAGTWAKAKVKLKKGTQSSHPLVSRLIKQKISELTVLIKLADWRSQTALCEYTDLDTLQIYPMVFPINALKDLESPLLVTPSSCSPAELQGDLVSCCRSLTTNCSLKTLVALWASAPSFMPSFKQISVPEIVHWLVMDELSEDRVEGWLKLAPPLIEQEDILLRPEQKGAMGKKQIIERTLRGLNQRPTAGNNKHNLKRIETLMKQAIKENKMDEIAMLHSWCIEAWKRLSQEISENRVSINLTDASDVYQRADSAGTCELAKGKDGNIIFPLHTHISPRSDIGALIISFEVSAFLSPNSKLKFYSDPQGLNTVHQTTVGKSTIQPIPPIVINDGKVWCHMHQGTIANLPLSVQEKSVPSSLPCCVYFIPAIWSTACWLTETLTTVLLGVREIKTIEAYYKPLISTICECVSKSKAPSILKQLSFMLISRLLRKMRFIYNSNPYIPGSCLEKLGLTHDWLHSLVEELSKLRDNDDMGAESLYSEYIQNGAELVSSALLPFKSSAGVEEQLDTKLVEQLKIPPWLHSVLSVGIFLNYFRGDGQLTPEITQAIFGSMRIHEAQKRNILLIRSLPKSLTNAELRTAVIEVLTNSKVRIVNPDIDIIIPKDDSLPQPSPQSHSGVCIAITDGFDINIEKTPAREEAVAPEPEAKEEPEAEPEPEQVESPVLLDWSCPSCTLVNAGASTACEACGTERPSVPVLAPEPEVKQEPAKPSMAEKVKEDEEKELWAELVESIKMIGRKKKEEPKPEEKKVEEKRPEPKSEEKKLPDSKHEEKKVPPLPVAVAVPPKPEEKKVPSPVPVASVPAAAKAPEVKKEEAPQPKEQKEPKEVKKEPDEKKQAEEEKESSKIEVVANPLSGEMDRHLFSVLKTRLCIPGTNEFCKDVAIAIEAIYRQIQARPGDSDRIQLSTHEFLTNLGLTKEQVPNMTLEELLQALNLLAACDPWLVWEFMAMQGFDMWCIKDSYASKKDMPSASNTAMLEAMMKFCEVDICNETKNVMRMTPLHLRFTPNDKQPIKMINGLDEVRLRAKHPRIFNFGLDVIRYNWALLKTFNDNLVRAIPYINWTMCVNWIPENSVPLTLSSFLSSARGLCLNYVKICLQQAVLDKTAVTRERPPRLTFERLKLARSNWGGRSREDDTRGKVLTESVFYRAYEQVKELDLTMMRPAKPQGSAPFLSFEIVFKGENVVGEGGPYRQFFADISSELQPSAASAAYTDTRSSSLHLLCPTPNTKNKQGEGQDKYTFTPLAKTTTDLLLYQFLGILMGCCIRTGVRLSLDLPPMIWKQIVGEPLTIADLEGIDKSVLNMLQYVTRPDLTAEAFMATFTENFTALLSDESSVELIPNGSNVSVTYDRREEYAELLLKTRMEESSAQCKAVRKGISLIVPVALLNFLTYQEVEALVCGKPVVDVALLKRHTRYSKGLPENSERIKFFWEVLNEFNEIDKLRFIKFCWGQERLPANDEEYERRQVRFMIKPVVRKNGNEEAALPRADTCFFNLELPNYKSKEVMKQRLLLAIHTDDVSMNAEDNPALDPRSSGRAEAEEEQE